TNKKFPVTSIWVNTLAGTVWIQVQPGVWIALGSGSGNVLSVIGTANQIASAPTTGNVILSLPLAIIAPGSLTTTTTLTGGTGITATTGNITASAGNVSASGSVTGGTGVTATTGNVTATAGAVNAGTSMTATLGNITATNGNLVLNGAGNKLVIHASTAASDSVGTSAALDGASPSQLVVSTTAVSAASKIFLTINTPAGTPGFLSVGTIVPGVSFQIKSSANGDTSTVNYLIIN